MQPISPARSRMPAAATCVAFLLPWCGFSVQVEPILEEVSAVASLASLPFNVGRYDVTPTNSLPDHLLSK